MKPKVKSSIIDDFIEKEDTRGATPYNTSASKSSGANPSKQADQAYDAPVSDTSNQTAPPKVYLQFGSDVFELLSPHIVRHQKSTIEIASEDTES